jgi:phosphoserine aminotransferase
MQPYDRVFNFSAGPCTLPVPVLEQVRDEMMNFRGSGMSLMEHSHRGKVYESVHNEAIADLKEIMNIPEGYTVLFLQGGATLQNTMIPMNLLGDGTGYYVVTGAWGQKSAEMGKLVGKTSVAWSGKSENYVGVPNLDELQFPADGSYIHFTSNETIQGVQFKSDPSNNAAPLVCDMSSDICSRPVDVSKYGLIYGGVQKNLGPAGMAVVIIRDDLLERTPADMHPMLSYKVHADNNSLFNTCPTFNIYVCGLVFKWLKNLGGLAEMEKINQKKAAYIYDAIDNSGGFYKGHANLDCRSLMNITFTLPSDELTDMFVKEAKAQKLDGLKGHRSVGGVRASVYNAFPVEGAETLAQFMKEFAAKNG